MVLRIKVNQIPNFALILIFYYQIPKNGVKENTFHNCLLVSFAIFAHLHETLSKLLPHKMLILTKFLEDGAKIVKVMKSQF